MSVIIMEGLDAMGKTTLAKMLANEIGGVYYKTPPKSFTGRCRQMDKNGVVYSEKRFNLYIKSVVCVSDIIKDLIKTNNQSVFIIDRWIWTTLAYHFAFNPQLYNKWQQNYQSIISNLLKADLNILLYIGDDEIWFERIKKRGIDNPDRLIVENIEVRKKIFELYLEFNPGFHLINNSGNINDSLQNILNLLP